MLDRLLADFEPHTDVPGLVSLRCLRNRYGASVCHRCEDCCPEKAIVIERTVSIDGSRCTGCLACIADCPTEALVPAEQGKNRVFSSKVPDPPADRIAVGCAKNTAVQPDLRVDCLAILSLHELAALILSAKITELHLEDCGQCNRLPAIESLRSKTAQVSRIMRADTENRLVLIDSKKAPASQYAQRRAFLQLVKKVVLHRVEQRMVTEEPTLPAKKTNRHVPERLQFFQQAVSRVDKSAQSTAGEQLYPTLTFLPHCDCCGKCVAACPTGALKKNRVKGKKIRFERLSCCGCGLCLEFCPLAAVSISSPLH